MKHLNASLSSFVLGLFVFTVFGLSSHGWAHTFFPGDLFVCLASVFIMLSLPYYMDIIEETTKLQNIIIAGALFFFSATLLCYNLLLWIVFVTFFLLLYSLLKLVRNPDVGKEEMPYQYLFRKKQYAKRVCILLLPFVVFYWVVVIAITHNVLPLKSITLW